LLSVDPGFGLFALLLVILTRDRLGKVDRASLLLNDRESMSARPDVRAGEPDCDDNPER
jgi:hypothetical protein